MSEAQVTITILPPGEGPSISSAQVTIVVQGPDGPDFDANNDSIVTAQDHAVSIPVLANDTVDGAQATPQNARPVITRQPTRGRAIANPNGTITFYPAAGQCGVVDFEYELTWP